MSCDVLVPLAAGFEEIEATTIVDVLRRAGINVTTAAVGKSKTVMGAHGIKIEADDLIEKVTSKKFNAVILPGGMPGSANLAESAELEKILKLHHSSNAHIAAICAAPTVLQKYGLLKGKKATAYPGFDTKLTDAKVVQDRVVEDGKIITSRGPGTALEFSLALVERLIGSAQAKELAAGMLAKA